MIKYLGSKRTLLPALEHVVAAVPDLRSVADVFSGTSRVGQALKRRGLQVFANDHNAFAATLARCYVGADAEDVLDDVRRLVDELNRLPGSPGWFTETYCERSRFFQPHNGERIDAIRDAIARLALSPELEAVLLVALMEAADRVDSTCGVQMAYLKRWAARSYNPLQLRIPGVIARSRHGPCRVTCADARSAIRDLVADVVYLDPPYNHHSYLNNYHIWESLVLWDKPEVYGVACKRIDCRERKSEFNIRARALDAFADVVRAARARLLIVSFSDDGWITRRELEALLGERGAVHVVAVDYRRYIGARIGIHNLRGEKVGTVGRLRNIEYIYIVDIEESGVDWHSISETMTAASVPAPVRRPRKRVSTTTAHNPA